MASFRVGGWAGGVSESRARTAGHIICVQRLTFIVIMELCAICVLAASALRILARLTIPLVMSIAVRFGNAYSVMNKLFHHPVQKFVGYGLGVLAVFGAFIFVQAQIAPGTVKSPVFIPPTDVSLSGIACNWSGTQKKQVGCDVGS